jgi:glycosyltransferase involved in cell wall biosynthesis
VSDYTYWVSKGLAAEGDEVHVWCPGRESLQVQEPGVVIHRELGQVTPSDLRRAGEQLDRFPAPRRILVQWVPHGYGCASMNLPFCWWLRDRAALHGDHVEIFVHEPYLPFSRTSLRQNGAALMHRVMTMVLLRAARHVWISIPAWEEKLRPYALKRRISLDWLPIPSNIPIDHDPDEIGRVRCRYLPNGGFLIGHFGTFSWPITSMLEPVLRALVSEPVNQTVLLMGIGSHEFRQQLIQKEPRFDGRLQAAGALAARDVSCHLAACDLLIQPYPDGVTTRRGSVMAGLSHGKPIVSTRGVLTDSFWKNTSALALAESRDVDGFVRLVEQLRNDAAERARMGQAARLLYQQRLDIAHTIAALRSGGQAVANCLCVS